MRIIKITSQTRRDFRATMECEQCGNIEKEVSGYDDRNFHDNVIPSMKCKKCSESTNSLGMEVKKTVTKYLPGMTV